MTTPTPTLGVLCMNCWEPFKADPLGVTCTDCPHCGDHKCGALQQQHGHPCTKATPEKEPA